MALGPLYLAQTLNPAIHRASGKLRLPASGDFNITLYEDHYPSSPSNFAPAGRFFPNIRFCG